MKWIVCCVMFVWFILDGPLCQAQIDITGVIATNEYKGQSGRPPDHARDLVLIGLEFSDVIPFDVDEGGKSYWGMVIIFR
jgi:hypothetical protein